MDKKDVNDLRRVLCIFCLKMYKIRKIMRVYRRKEYRDMMLNLRILKLDRGMIK